MRRALVTAIVILVVLSPARAAASNATIRIETGGSVSQGDVTIYGGDSVTWKNDDPALSHKVFIDGGDITGGGIPANGGTHKETFPDPGGTDATVDYHIDSAGGPGGTITVKASATSTTSTTQPTSTTESSTTTTTSSSSTTSSTSSTTTSSSTTTTTTTTTTVISSASGQIPIRNKGGTSGSSSALPLLLGAFIVVAGLAGLAYWLWLRSGEPYEDDGPDWTQEPPPTVQGPRI